MSLSTLRTPSRGADRQIHALTTGQSFFSSEPDGVFNLLPSFTDMKELERLHCLFDSNKPSKSLRKCNLRQYDHHS